MSLPFATTFGVKDRRFLTAFIDSCDTTAPSHDDLNVQAEIDAFFRGDVSTYDCAFTVAEYLQYTRGNGVDLFNIEGIFELLEPMELATFIGELRWTLAVDGVELSVTLVNFAERVAMHADVSLEDYTEAIDTIIESL